MNDKKRLKEVTKRILAKVEMELEAGTALAPGRVGWERGWLKNGDIIQSSGCHCLVGLLGLSSPNDTELTYHQQTARHLGLKVEEVRSLETGFEDFAVSFIFDPDLIALGERIRKEYV